MSGKRIKNNDIKNILKFNDEKKFLLFEPILNRAKNRNNNNIYNENYLSDKEGNKTIKINNKNLIIKNNKKNKIFIKSKAAYNTPKTNNNNINTKINNKLKINHPFVTSVDFKNIQTNEEDSKILSSKFQSKKNNLVCFGKSLNQILINNINEAIMKNGNIIKKKKRKNFSANIFNKFHNLKNFNNYEMHKQIFDDKLIEMYEDIQKKQKFYKKQRLNYLMPDLEERKKKVIARIPLYIKGYKKNEIDMFYTRNICDLDYQKYYMKDKINMNDILENHNIYNRKDYLSGKVPYFMLTKTVVKPICKKSFSQKNMIPHNYKEITI